MSKSIYHIHLCGIGYKNKGITKGFIANGWSCHEVDYTHRKQVLGILRMRASMLKEINEIKPDLVFAQVHSKDILDSHFCDLVMAVCPMIIVNIDTREPKDMQWLYELNGHVTEVGYSNGNDIEQCKELGITNCFVFQGSCDTDEYYPLPKDESKKYPEIVFIGNRSTKYPNSQQRIDMIEALEKEFGDRFEAVGLGFGRRGFANVEMERELYSNAKIGICHNNFDYPEYESDRYWRATFSGATTVHFCSGDILKDFIEFIRDFITTAQDFKHWGGLKEKIKKENTYTQRIKQVESLLAGRYGLIFENEKTENVSF